MSCTRPMIRIEDWNGKIYIMKGEEVKQEEEKKKKYIENNKKNKYELLQLKWYKKYDMIPCGKCIGCRLDYSREWANRIIVESKEYPKNTCWFLTLTYNDENIPTKSIINKETGEEKIGITLYKKDVQEFIKKLRRHYEYKYNHTGIRYFLAGEYGEKTNRPHYHACIFNMPIMTEMILFKKNEIGQPIWTNEKIEKIWGKGFITIGRLSWETAAYTARYIMKKQKGENAEWFYKNQAKNPEFTLMSRKPGIGKKYYDDNKEKIYKYDEIIIERGNKPIKAKPPKYYDKLYDITNHDELQIIKAKRKEIMEKTENNKDKKTTLTRAERRIIQERTNEEKNRKLIRDL